MNYDIDINYRHQFVDGSSAHLPLGKVVCVGRNYADHVAELNNDTPSEPLLFMKGNNAMVHMHSPIEIPSEGECHNELELCFLIGKKLHKLNPKDDVVDAIAGVGLALDLTLRDVQTGLKQKGHPWERAKAFDGSCPLSRFIKPELIDFDADFAFQLRVDDELRQSGNSQNMIWNWRELIAHISQVFTLFPGDVVLTGTPKGVGKLSKGDTISAALNGHLTIDSHVV